jgi:hypothetical protein
MCAFGFCRSGFVKTDILREPWLPWAASVFFAVVVGVFELVILNYARVDQATAAILGATFWLFTSLAVFHRQAMDRASDVMSRLKLVESAAAAGVSPIWSDEALRSEMNRTVAVYSRIQHPLLRDLAIQDFTKAIKGLNFEEVRSSEITHEDFGLAVERYIRNHVRSVRALSKSWVTNWDKFKASSSNYRNAQLGKDVQRIFVLRDEAEFEKFRKRIFDAHEADFGGEAFYICSAAVVSVLVDSLPPSERVREDEDFAIFDDDVVALCQGDRVRVRTDEIGRCRRVFQSVLQYVKSNKQSYAAIKGDPDRIAAIFNAPDLEEA